MYSSNVFCAGLINYAIVFLFSSNTEEAFPRFSLVPGKSEQTNKENTFRLETKGNQAFLLLGAIALDYEKLTEYTLTVRAEVSFFFTFFFSLCKIMIVELCGFLRLSL